MTQCQKRRPHVVVYLTTIQKNKDDESWTQVYDEELKLIQGRHGESSSKSQDYKPKPELKW